MSEFVDYIPLALSGLALLVSAVTYRDRRRQDRRDLFLRVHERLVDPDIQHGRRLLYERVDSVSDAAHLREHEVEVYQLINRAVAMFDIFAMYVQRGYINRDVALEEWGHAFARFFTRAEPLIEDRVTDQSWTPWPHFRNFGGEAVAWHDAHS